MSLMKVNWLWLRRRIKVDKKTKELINKMFKEAESDGYKKGIEKAIYFIKEFNCDTEEEIIERLNKEIMEEK